VSDWTGSLTVVIWPEVFARLAKAPVMGSQVTLSGRLAQHEGELQVRVMDPGQLHVHAAAPVAEERALAVPLPLGSVTQALGGRMVSVKGQVELVRPSEGPRVPHVLTVRDATGSGPVVVWPEVYVRLAAAPKAGDWVEATGRVAVWDGSAQIAVRDADQLLIAAESPEIPSESADDSDASPTSVSVAPRSVIIESGEAGQGTSDYTEVTGQWHDSTARSTAAGLTPEIGSRWADISGGPGGAVARWTLTPETSGEFEAQVTWPSSANAVNVTYRVSAGSEVLLRRVTQDGNGFLGGANGNVWIPLGRFEAGPNSPVVIEVNDASVSGQPDESSPGRMCADAARLVPLSQESVVQVAESPPPPPPQAVISEPVAPAPTSPAAPAEIEWVFDHTMAESLAREAGRDLLLFFVTSRSRDARRMVAETWSDPAVVAAVSGQHVAAMLSMETNQDLCRRLNVYSGANERGRTHRPRAAGRPRGAGGDSRPARLIGHRGGRRRARIGSGRRCAARPGWSRCAFARAARPPTRSP
jgi:hypothetical protein